MWRDPFDGSFYPRPPYGGRRGDAQARQRRAHVSILALHTEGDFKEFERLQAQLVSILALHTEGDHQIAHKAGYYVVSILALHTEGDNDSLRSTVL